MRPEIEMDARHRYTVEGEVFPSVTTIINATVPKDLSWWGMQVGCDGAAWLLQRDLLSNSYTGAQIVDLLKKHKLHVYSQRDKAAERGTLIHKTLETYGATGELVFPDGLDEKDHPRLGKLAKWLRENQPLFLDQEVRTFSRTYRYAGTFDARVRFEAGEHEGAVALLDLKTGKRVYPDSQFPQLEAYEQAEVELGQEPSDFRAVLHLPPEDDASLVVSTDTFDDFLVLLRQFESMRSRKQRLKEVERVS